MYEGYMKKLFFCTFLFVSFLSFGQSKLLLVKDESLGYGNTDTVKSALAATGSTVTVFSAPDSGRTPTAIEMKKYDLVIWYCSSNGINLWFWNNAQTDNPELVTYLNGGGKLWVIGTDLLYNRYGGSATFATNSFPYTQMGLASYDVQSYGNDGGVGVSLLYRDKGYTLPIPDTLRWVYSTLWWVDGVTLRPSAISVYKMGPAGYALAGKDASVLYTNGSSYVMSYFFDIAMVDSYAHRVALAKEVVSEFKSNFNPSAVQHEPIKKSAQLNLEQNYPNPFNPTTVIAFHLDKPAFVNLSVFDVLGNKVAELIKGEQASGDHKISFDAGAYKISSSIYIYKLTTPETAISKKMTYTK
jgi:hypothetical protein